MYDKPNQTPMFRYAKGHQTKGNWTLAGFKRWLSRMDRKTIVKNLILGVIAIGLFGALVLFGLFAWYSKDLPDPNSLAIRDVDQATKIYDRTGTHVLYEIYGEENRTLVKMQEGFCKDDTSFETDVNGIPLFVAQAVLTAEDRKFCSHHGFSFTGLMRAALFGGTRGGGSTLTQQLVKNAILTNERSLPRKIKELILSVALEQKYSKDDILQIYFNEIPYGSTYYGVQTASQNFYGKDVKDLTLAEGATLAGIPQRPTYFINNPDALKERRDWILTSMADLGYITTEQADAAKAEDTPLQIDDSDITAPHFVMWVKGMLEEEFDTKTVETGGLKVITTLDYDKQIIAEEAIDTGVATYGTSYGFTSAGLLSMDPRTGQVLAMVGSPEFSNEEIDGQVNVTLQPLQPGSSIKPIVYAAAFEKGYTPNTLLWDVKTTFNTETGPYNPQNYSLNENGIVSMRKALQGSLNIPAVKTLYLVGIDNAVSFAHRLGYTTLQDRSQIGLSMVLGGAEVKMIDHVGAYATFANGGVHHNPVAILKVENSKGDVLKEYKAEEDKGESVLDANIAATITNVLSDDGARAYVFGPGGYLTLPGRPAAAKTGTTNNYKDAWTVGFTPSLATGVWVGNADGSLMKGQADGSKIAAPIWQDFMKKSLQGTPVESFTAPSIPGTGKPVLDGQLSAKEVVIDRSTGKLATDRTPESRRQTIKCGEYHTILYYVDRSNPAGPAPENPAKDPSYTSWEAAVQDYIARFNARPENVDKQLSSCNIPTDDDDVHTKQNQPEISILTPDNNDHVGRTFEVHIQSSVIRSFNRVEYWVDDSFVASSTSMDGMTITLPSWVQKGKHELSATIFDDVDNSATDSVRINVEDAASTAEVKITNPFDDQVIEREGSSTNYSVAVEVPTNAAISSLEVRVRNLWTGEEMSLANVVSPSAIVSVTWNITEDAQYMLTATAFTQTGDALQAIPVNVTVREKSGLGIPLL